MYITGEWGTVCGLSWDPLDSKVVCQQLGYKGVNRTYSNASHHNFGEGTRQSWLSSLHCTGSEANLLKCPHDGDLVRTRCPHSYDVGVVCTNEDLPDEGEWIWVSRRVVQCTVNHILQNIPNLVSRRKFHTHKEHDTLHTFGVDRCDYIDSSSGPDLCPVFYMYCYIGVWFHYC